MTSCTTLHMFGVITPSKATLLFNSITYLDPLTPLLIDQSTTRDEISQFQKENPNIYFKTTPASLIVLDALKIPLFVELDAPITLDLLAQFKSLSYVRPAISASQLDLDFNSPSKLNIGLVITTLMNTDRPDALFPTIVSDQNGVSLGLVYSSSQSLSESLSTSEGVYQSRKRGLWYKGASSGATQKVLSISVDCDSDCLLFCVEQLGKGFCHLETKSCFGNIPFTFQSLCDTLVDRLVDSTPGSYTKRLFEDDQLLQSKILEEASELVEAKSKDEIAGECADLFYFSLVKCVKNNVSLQDIQSKLEERSLSGKRRPGNSKPQFDAALAKMNLDSTNTNPVKENTSLLQRFTAKEMSSSELDNVLKRPIMNTKEIMSRVEPIVSQVKTRGDAALIEFTEKFDNVKLDASSLVLHAPFPESLQRIPENVKNAIDIAYRNIYKFHAAQVGEKVLTVETMKGVVCERIQMAMERVGVYVPGGSAVLPSTALMLGIPAQVAGVNEIIVATPPRSDGSICPEVVYVAGLVGAKMILKVGGAQAIAAMAYGTESVPKVQKICGPGNQYVTCAKMIVQNDVSSLVSIDMPAGPSEVLVIADSSSPIKYVISDLLSQAEHGPDSQVILISIGDLDGVHEELEAQLNALPRKDIARIALSKSRWIQVDTVEEAMRISNLYAPEHLIVHVETPRRIMSMVKNAGSIFLGPYTPESCGDYASGTNHTLPTYGYAQSYSGVSTSTFLKYVTCQEITKEGLSNLGPVVMTLAEREGLDGHKNAVAVRLEDF